ncbi:MAG: uracil-DNA glycosylase family protein [Saprospiraceae bacterium]
MTKQEKYRQLVNLRLQEIFPPGLQNPSQIEAGKFDCAQLGPWSLWQSDLNAEMLIIGQDWGDENYFLMNKGRDTDDNPTNQNLRKLLASIGLDPGLPSCPASQPLFFTNAVLGIKSGGMSTVLKHDWLRHSSLNFTGPLIEIIQPRLIVTLGASAYKALRFLFPYLPYEPMNNLLKYPPSHLPDIGVLFTMAHCGGLGTVHRSLEEQLKDWKKIVPYLPSPKLKT